MSTARNDEGVLVQHTLRFEFLQFMHGALILIAMFRGSGIADMLSHR